MSTGRGGNKYKKCCLAKEEAAEREELAKVEAKRAENAAAHRLHLQEARAAMVAGFAAEDDEEDELTIASNAAVDVSVSAVSDGPLSKDFDGLPASASRAL